MPITHYLKIAPPYFNAVVDGDKNFEIRNNDRGYNRGDTVILEEFDRLLDHPVLPYKEWYSGRKATVKITYVTNFMQKDEYVVFGFKLIDVEDPKKAKKEWKEIHEMLVEPTEEK